MNVPDYQKSTALAALGGYAYQLMWGLLALAKATNKNSRVGIEVLDDITIADGKLISLQQTKKSANTEKSPFTDLNINLWKTFAIWVSYAKDKDPTCKNTEFHLVTNANVKDEHTISFLLKGSSASAVDAYIAQVRELKSDNDDVKNNIQKCLGNDIEIFKKVLSKCKLIDGSAMSDSLLSELSDHLGIPPNTDSEAFSYQIMGWYINAVLNKLELKEELWIGKNEYIQAHSTAVISFNAPQNIGSDNIAVKADEQYQALAQDRTYIKQLGLIDITRENEINDAIHDYFRFARTKSQTINRGEVLSRDWDKDTERLKDYWQQTNQTECRSVTEETPAHKIGQTIYDKCRGYTGLPPLNGSQREAFVVRGHFHVLADEETIWWHPDYQEIKDK